MRISFLLPGLGHNVPIGGFKVVYEYANRFSRDGHVVTIVYICDSCQEGEKLSEHLYNFLKYLYKRIFGYSGSKWFSLDKGIKERCVLYGRNGALPDSDCFVATANTMAVVLNRLRKGRGNLVYFIQGYETWNMDVKTLYKTYHYDMKKIVISNDLHKILLEQGVESIVIPNGFNFSEFTYTIPIEDRSRYTVNMLYHESKDKGCEYGFEAIEIVKRKYPQLSVVIWGTPQRPKWLNKDYIYYSRPNNELHNKINNESAIFIAPSLNEGWGLTVGEAMMSGEAVVCTDNNGYLELAEDNYNALVSPIKDSTAMANNIIKLIEDDNLRCTIAHNGLEHIAKYTWDNSYLMFQEVCSLL